MDIVNYITLLEIIKELHGSPRPVIIKGSEGKYKVNFYNDADFRAMQHILEEKHMKWFTYENKNERPIKVIMRGLDGSINFENIKIDLASMGYTILNVSNIEHKKSDPNNQAIKIKVKALKKVMT